MSCSKKQIRQLYHGDCLELMADIPDGSVDFICCDPPYGTTACAWDKVLDFGKLWEHYWRVLKPTGAVALFGIGVFGASLIMSQAKYFKYKWIWAKNTQSGFLDAKKRPLRKFEEIMIFRRKTGTYNPQMTPGESYRPAAARKSRWRDDDTVGGGGQNVYGKYTKASALARGGGRSESSTSPSGIVNFP